MNCSSRVFLRAQNLKPSVIALLTALTVSNANANESEQNDSAKIKKDDKIEAITVTATKRSQVIYEVPIAMSAFSGDALAGQGVVGITDIGKFVPNLNITGFSAGHTSSANPFIRGIGLQDHLITTDPGVSIYVDGVYLGRQVGQNWNLSNIDRVEVLRGPQGTLYGRNSIGGAINIITKQPNNEAKTTVAAEAGTRGRLKGDVFVNRGLTDDLSFNFNAGFNKRDGLGEFINLPDAKWDVGETEEFYGRASVKFIANDELRFVLTADANDAVGGLRPYTTLIDEVPTGAYYTGERWGSPTPAGPLRNSDVAANPYDNATGTIEVTEVTNKASGVSFTADYDVSEVLGAKFIASQRSSEYKAGLDDDGTIYALDHYPERGSADQTSVELQLNGYLGNMDFVSGLYWFEETGKNRQGDDSSFNGGGNILELDQKTQSEAAYVNVGYEMTDDLRVSGGVRYTIDSKEASANVGVDVAHSKDSWRQWSYDLSANLRLDNDMNAYASIQSGYQGGQYPARPYCLFGNPECFVATDNITAVNYEMGLKGEVNADFSMSVAVFTTYYEDLPYQVNTTSEGGFDTRNLVVTQNSMGIEWESTALITDRLTLHTTAGYINVDVDKQDGVQPVAPLTPEWTASISPSYLFDLNNGDEVTVRMDYSFRDEMYGEPSADEGRMTQIDSRSLINFDVKYQPANSDWTLSFYGRNVTDERYDDARLNTGDYLLVIKSNDASEFGLRYNLNF
jgi:iron complex outermembrane recepter protein